MRIRGILSANIFVSSFEDVRRFYLDDLTIPYGSTRPGVNTLYMGETSLGFITASESDQSLIGGNSGVTLRMRGEGDLARMIRRLKERGHGLSDNNFRELRQGHVLTIKDPAGNRIALWEDPEWNSSPHIYEGPSSISIKVRDIRRALAFYHAVLELPMFDQPEADTAVFFPDATHLIVTTGDQWSPCPPKSGETGLCLHSDEMASLIGGLKHRGVRFVGEPQFTDDVMAVTIVDPDGNQITFMGPNT